ncbi:alpha/beta-hydrolase [Stipitochalara longipes BDJ]|nr:alpha/beta-hydrolase [Stipitochalara longipes BDJ]
MATKWESKTLTHGIHALVAGQGTPIVLLPGWPQTAEAFSELISLLSPHHTIYALDPPGLGDSAPSITGYDTTSISRTLHSAIETVISGPYHLVGHDVGAWIAYAWAAQFPSSLLSLTVLDSGIPGTLQAAFPLPYEVNLKLWQFSFNRLPDLPEILTKGKEKDLLDWLFETKAVHPERITKEKRERYVECYSKEGAMARGFAYYRAMDDSAVQNKGFGEQRLGMPVLALGGESKAVGKGMLVAMEKLADRAEGGVIEDCGHFVMEEQPEKLAGRFVKTLENSDVKFVAKRVLQAIQALHEDGYTHTDIKPDNILVNCGTGSSRFANVQLADFGDVTQIDPKDYLKVGMDGPHMGAAIFRSPEAMIQLRWGQSTDIWSFGTTLISLIWGLNWHMFKPDPKDATADDEEYLIHIIIKQLAHFRPVPKSYIDLIPRKDSYRWTILGSATQYIKENQKQRPFKIIEDDCLTEEDREFLLKVMKLDPRDRPTARQLLQDKWFSGVP